MGNVNKDGEVEHNDTYDQGSEIQQIFKSGKACTPPMNTEAQGLQGNNNKVYNGDNGRP